MTGLVAFLAVILLGIGYASMIYMETKRNGNPYCINYNNSWYLHAIWLTSSGY